MLTDSEQLIIKEATDIYFIDSVSYKNLFNKDLQLEELTNTLLIKRNDKISLFTQAMLIDLNVTLNSLIFDNDITLTYKLVKDYVGEVDLNAIKSEVRDYLFDSSSEKEKYYDIKPLPNTKLLAVVYPGFLHYLTKTKDNLLKFILECLCYEYKAAELKPAIVKQYIFYKLSDMNFSNFKLKVS